MNNNRLSFPNGFEKTEVRGEKIKIKLAPNKEKEEVRHPTRKKEILYKYGLG